MTKVQIEGAVQTPLELGYEELQALPGQVADVSQVVPGKPGAGVRLAGALERAGVDPEASKVLIESTDGSFSATLPLAEVADAVLVYRLGDGPLPPEKGGPVRFLTPHPDGACDKADGHACANVKGLGRLHLTR